MQQVLSHVWCKHVANKKESWIHMLDVMVSSKFAKARRDDVITVPTHATQ